MDIILALCVVGFMGVMWGHVCNNRTYDERKRVRDVVFGADNWVALRNDFGAVDYDTHFWMRMSFRNPMPLYGSRILEKLPASGRTPPSSNNEITPESNGDTA